MNTFGLPKNEHATWPQQADLSLPVEDRHVDTESLLQRTIRECFEAANRVIKNGEYDQTMECCGRLLKLASEGATGELSESGICYVSKAFIDYVYYGRFSLKLPQMEQSQQIATNGISTNTRWTHLLEIIKKGIAWLEKNNRPEWKAGLLLERALLLKDQGMYEDALCAMEEAHQNKNKESCKGAPGFSLFTHELELAELLYATAIGEKDDKLVKAAGLVSAIPSDSKSTLAERMRSSLVLAKIRQKQGEENTANVELGKAQKFAHEIEQATVAEHAHQAIGSIYQDTRKLQGMMAEIDQTLQAVKDNAEGLKSIAVHSMVVSPVSDSQETTSTRHISCYISFPHCKEEKDESFYQQILLPALRSVLECHPYYWQVGCHKDELDHGQHKCNDCPVRRRPGKGKRDCWLKCADVYIISIEGWSPDVFADLGSIDALLMMGNEKRLIILKPEYAESDRQTKQDEVEQSLAYHLRDFGEVLSIPAHLRGNADPSNKGLTDFFIGEFASHLRTLFHDQHFPELNKKPRKHYLSSQWIEKQCKYPEEIARIISKQYITMEIFREAVAGLAGDADAKKVKVEAEKLASWGVNERIIKSILDEVKDILKKENST